MRRRRERLIESEAERRAYAAGALAAIPDDLPDGAYLAMVEEAGIEVEELIDEEDDDATA